MTDDGCCHKTRLRGSPCPLGRKCPYIPEGEAVPTYMGYRPAAVIAKDLMRAPIPCTDVTILIAYEGGRRDALSDVLESAKTMTRGMLIQWLEAEIARL